MQINIYDAQNDEYVCPAKERMGYRFSTEDKGKKLRVYVTSRC